MHKAKKKSFNWYGMKQHFSIRKYHFGAASVLLGMSLAVGAGAQTAQAETTTATTEAATLASSTEVAPSTTTEASATEATTTTASTEVATTERTVTIEYTVEYQDESGKVVESTVKSIETKTTDKTAIAIVTETATVPADYELVANELTTSTTGVVEGANTKVVFKVVKKVVADTTSTTTSTSSTDTASTSTSSSTVVAPPPTTATASAPKVAVPTTVEEAKVVLEQVTSEAEVLANEGNRIVATDTTTDTSALKAAAAATKLAATDATSVLQDTVATLDALNTQISAVRTNVEALVLELRKYLGTDVIEIALNTSLTSGLKVGEGEGILVEKGTTATPSMDDANGAGIKTHTLRTGVAATSQAGWYTFESYDFYSYNANQPSVYINGTAIPAYIRYSLDSNANTSTILAEVVSTTNGNVLETHTIEQGASVTLTYPQTVNPENETVTITYDTNLEIDGRTQGVLVLKGAKNGNVVDYNMMIVPDYQINTTRYIVEDGTVLATYSLQTIAGQPVTSSGQREFAGYAYKTTTKEVVQGGLPAGTVYMAGKVDQSTVHYKAIRKIISNDQVVTEYYFLDPTYTGPVDWNGTDTTGFIKLIETSPLTYTDGKTYDYNKSSTIYAPYTIDEESGYMVFKESPVNEHGSKYRVVAQWSGTGEAGTYGRIFIGTQVYTTAQELGDFELKWRGVNDKFDKLGGETGYAPFGIQQNLRNATIATAFETTHIYTPVPQEAIIRYQVEGATDFLEDSGTLTGNPGTDITYSTEDTINKYKKLGYELVSDNFTTDAGQDYDYDTAVKQEFLVVIKPRIVDVPKGVVPGEPVDPTDPNSPVWPDTVNNLETTQEVTRTVEYKYEDGTPVRVDAAGNVLPKGSTEGTPFVKTETVSFTRPAQVNLVTGEVTYGDWVADTTDTLQGNVLPEVPGYSASRTTLEGAEAPMTETVKDKTVTATDADINEVVYFKENPKYGDVVVNYVNTDGKVIATPVVDTNDALVGTDYTTADRVPEKIVEDATGDVYYYKEIKAEDAAKETGKVVEGTTEVTYVYEKAGNVVVNYITEDGTVIKTPVNDETNAKPDSPYDTTDNKPTEIVTEDGSRYVLIPSKTIGTENGTVEGGKTTEITYVYKKVANWVPQIPGVPEGQEPKVPYPFDPNNPDVPVTPTPDTVIPNVPGYTPVDPKDNTPLKPVDPNDPGKGYVPPTPDETGKDTPIPYVQNGNVVVNYVTEDGTVIKAPVQDETNVPAGKSYDTTDNKPTEIVTEDGSRYVLIPSKTIGTENGTVEGGKTTEITYVYKKVANWVPEIPGVPENERPVIPYPFDPNNPDVPVTPTPDTVIPNVPGYTPVDPKDNTPLKPVDPNDPGKGYVPPTPDETGKDTPIPYVQNGNVVVNYVTEDGTVIKAPVQDETNVPAGKSYDTTDNKPKTITTEDGTTYELVRVDGSENGKVEGGKTTEVTYVYRKVTPAKKVVTNHVDEDGNPIAPQEEGTTPNKSIPGYEFTGKTVTDPDGNTTHIYRKVKKVVTNHVDEDDNPIAPQEEGTTPNKSIPGYEFTGKTVTDPDGNTTHIYHKVVTNHVDEEGNPIAPQEEGTTPDKSIPGYEFTGKTITDEDGNTTHIYKKTPTKTVITKHVDEEGNPVAPQEDGTTPNKSIPGYEYVRTVVDVEGNTTHIYRKVSNKPTPPATETPVKPQPATPTPTADKAKQLPNTGEASSSAGVLGAAMLVAAIALAGKRRRNED
ncbi:YSIRK-type signal peptide-containing protein [Streptococcus suis]|uniref:MucBP domain-containing protein n=5 Tax=Streptococcus suis TaxID=1307 RepID=UPI001DC31F71|nr:MucBP domain-containing protein [Streptococcus suis]MBS8094205.1 YSIRK-type signal peptide-containing protein [Streptococcus suis]